MIKPTTLFLALTLGAISAQAAGPINCTTTSPATCYQGGKSIKNQDDDLAIAVEKRQVIGLQDAKMPGLRIRDTKLAPSPRAQVEAEIASYRATGYTCVETATYVRCDKEIRGNAADAGPLKAEVARVLGEQLSAN